MIIVLKTRQYQVLIIYTTFLNNWGYYKQ